MEFQCFEVKPEDDSKEITECSYDDKPSTGMFSVSSWGNFLHWCSLCTTLMLWCFYCLSTQVNVNVTRLTCDKSVHLSVHLALDKYVKVKCLSKPIRPISQHWSQFLDLQPVKATRLQTLDQCVVCCVCLPLSFHPLPNYTAWWHRQWSARICPTWTQVQRRHVTSRHITRQCVHLSICTS